MPFTFSHPAIILPLTYLPKRYFSLTGLVIGTLTPDFEYFLRMRIKSVHSHDIDGLFWFDLPLGIALTFIFHNLVRNELLKNLPKILRTRFLIHSGFKWNSYFKKNCLTVTLSILIGAASHIFWDSFTHSSGYFVNLIPTLNYQLEIYNKSIPMFKILQHFSTILGGLIILFSIYQMPKYPYCNEKIDTNYCVGFPFLVRF